MKTKNKKNLKPSTKKTLKILIYLTAFVALIGIYHTQHLLQPVTASAPYGQFSLPDNPDKEIKPLDIFLTKTRNKTKAEQIEMWEVIDCESGFNPNAKSNTSTASGISQFINKTWNNYCEGDVFNAEDNLNCFFKLYPKHKSWWECSRLLGYTI
jgi:hypothetical protein